MKKSDEIQYLRALAAVSIVIYHAGGITSAEKYQGNSEIKLFTSGLATGVDIFFVISGFVLSAAIYASDRPSPKEFVFDRALRIYPMSILTVLIFSISGYIALGQEINVGQFISSILLIPSSVEPYPIVLWTLKQEILFYAILIMCAQLKQVGTALLLLWGFLSLLFNRVWADESWFVGWLFHNQNFEFVVGYLTFEIWRRIKLHPKVAASAFRVLTIVFVAFSILSSGLELPSQVKILATSTLAGLCVISAASSEMKRSQFLYFLGSASYSIYLIHFFFLSLINKMLSKLDIPDLMAFVALVFFAVSFGSIYFIVFEAPMERLRKRIKKV